MSIQNSENEPALRATPKPRLFLLRPHHGMCLAYFIGKGYSKDFSTHMSSVQSRLKSGAVIRLTLSADVICSACPNLADGSCAASGKASGYDRAVLEMCGLTEGCVLPFSEFTALVEEKILTPGLRPSICGSCQWNGLCMRRV